MSAYELILSAWSGESIILTNHFTISLIFYFEHQFVINLPIHPEFYQQTIQQNPTKPQQSSQ